MICRPIKAACRLILAALLAAALFLALSGTARAEESVTRTNGQVYTIINTVQLENRSARPIYNIRLAVPLSEAESVVWQDFLGEEFSPQPVEITTDADGTRVAVYSLSQLDVGETVQLIQRVAVRNYCVSFDAQTMTDEPVPERLSAYLAPTENINSDMEEIREFARLAAASSNNAYLKARLLFAAVNQYMTYDNSARDSHSAAQAYQTRRGNCEDYANLYAAGLRSLGIPARVCSGYLYSREAQTNNSYLSPAGHIDADKIRHSWVTFYISGMGWLVADPTFSYSSGKNGDTIVDWDRFAKITPANRLVYTGGQLPDNNSISYTYQGAAPHVTYHSELALYSLILPFKDLVDHWAADSVLGLYYNTPQLVTGISDNYFGVNENLTRAELAAMLNRALDNAAPLSRASMREISFSDLSETHWAYNEVAKAVARGILTGYPDGTVRPDAEITRAEAAVMLSRVIGGATPGTPISYNDVTAAGYGWAADAIAHLSALQIMNGVAAGTFEPGRTMTRGEGATIIYRWLQSDVYRNAYLNY